MIAQQIDGVSFRLNEEKDFSFFARYGAAFCAFDATGSGCISFGMDDGRRKRFVKIAGAKTIRPYIGTMEAVETLKAAMPIYAALKHPGLIKLLEHFPLGDLYVAVFGWAEGECLFDF